MKELVDRYVALTRARRDMRETLAGIEEELRRAEELLVDELTRAGLRNVKTDAGDTVYLRTRLHASAGAGTEDLCQALKRDPVTRWLVRETVHAGQLSTWVRERLEEGNLPEDLKPHIKITEVTRLGVRSKS